MCACHEPECLSEISYLCVWREKMLSSFLLYCCFQEDGVTSPRSEEGYGRAGPGLLLWQALSRQCECCPSGFASLERAGCSLCLGLASQAAASVEQYQHRVGRSACAVLSAVFLALGWVVWRRMGPCAGWQGCERCCFKNSISSWLGL